MQRHRRNRAQLLRRCALATWLVAVGVASATCTEYLDPRTAPRIAEDELLTLERRLARRTLRYQDHDPPDGYANPQGLYLERTAAGDVLWVWSTDHRRQIGLRRDPRGRWQPAQQRRGPRRTRDCQLGRGRLAGRTFCVGDRQRGGLVVWGEPGFACQLPPRGGFVGMTLDHERGRVHVVDAVDQRLWTLDAEGAVIGSVTVPAAVNHVGWLGRGHLWLAARAPMQLAVVAVGDDGLPEPSWRSHPRHAPVRGAHFDAGRQMLWLVGPEDVPVRRHRGVLQQLRSALQGHRVADLLASRSAPSMTIDLGVHGLVDASHIALLNDQLLITAAGSNRVALVQPERQTVQVQTTGAHPQAVLAVGPGSVAVANRLDDSVALYRATSGGLQPLTTVVLDGRPRASLEQLGERLYFGIQLWQTPTADAYSCNSCHWDTGSDHRTQPGFEERRQEITRPLGGIGAIRPIFSTGGAPSLTVAIEGLLRDLDYRFYEPRTFSDAWWNDPRTVGLKGGEQRTLDARQLREALLRYLMSLPVPTPVLRQVGQPFSDRAQRGFALFARDCLSCHEASRDMRRRDRVPTDQVLRVLRAEPLTFGQAAWSKTGIEPYYHNNGNRISPLLDLGRGGPFFSNRSAHTIEQVLERARPGAQLVHGGGTEHPGYRREQVEALRELLLSI